MILKSFTQRVKVIFSSRYYTLIYPHLCWRDFVKTVCAECGNSSAAEAKEWTQLTHFLIFFNQPLFYVIPRSNKSTDKFESCNNIYFQIWKYSFCLVFKVWIYNAKAFFVLQIIPWLWSFNTELVNPRKNDTSEGFWVFWWEVIDLFHMLSFLTNHLESFLLCWV